MDVTRANTYPQRRLEPRAVLERLSEHHPKIDVHLEEPEYQGISEHDGARMLGYFTQTMKDQGFPWRLFEATEAEDGQCVRGQSVSALDTLRRLQQGKPVLLQPLRNLQLDLSSDSLGAVAAASALGGGAGELTSVAKLADLTKDTKVTPGSQGIELKYGEPIVVSNFAELKLLYQMYNPAAEIKSKSEVARAANQLSYFTQQTASSQYPWRFYKETQGSPAVRVAKAVTKSALQGTGVGAGVGALIGAPIALITRSWQTLLGASALGAAGFALYSASQAARTAAKGVGVNAVEALERVLSGHEVVAQETQIRSIGVPIFGKISWFSDHGKGSKITDPQDLDTFYWMQNQDAKPEAAKPEPPKPPAPSVVIIDNHFGPETHLHEGVELNQPLAVIQTPQSAV